MPSDAYAHAIAGSLISRRVPHHRLGTGGVARSQRRAHVTPTVWILTDTAIRPRARVSFHIIRPSVGRQGSPAVMVCWVAAGITWPYSTAAAIVPHLGFQS